MAFRPAGKLKNVFSRGSTPDPGEMRGYFEVRLVMPLLPPIRFFGHLKFFPADVENPQPGSGGFNEFLSRIRIGCFRIASGESVLGDGQRVLQIIYNRPGNPFWVRPLTDELKKISEGIFLGRGILRLFGFSFNSFYFTVEKASKQSASDESPAGHEKKKKPEAKPGGRGGKNQKAVIRGKQKEMLTAVMAVIVPQGGPFPPGAADFDLLPRLNELLAKLDPMVRRLLPLVLFWVNLRCLFFTGCPLIKLSEERAIRFFSGMENSRLVHNHYIMLLLKLLTMLVFYEQPEAARAIGYEHGCHLHPDTT